jgi:hypothetical protein
MSQEDGAAGAADYEGALRDIETQVRGAVHAALVGHLTKFKAENSATLTFVVSALLKSKQYSAETLARHVGVSRPTLGRWGDGDNIPRAIGYRVWLVNSLVDFAAREANVRHAPGRELEPKRPGLSEVGATEVGATDKFTPM